MQDIANIMENKTDKITFIEGESSIPLKVEKLTMVKSITATAVKIRM
jgi:hypothetical protein